MSHEIKHPLALRGRDLPDRGADHWQSCSLVVHKTSGTSALVSLVVTDRSGSHCKDTRLGEVWVRQRDHVGRELAPLELLTAALSALVEGRPQRLVPEPTDTRP